MRKLLVANNVKDHRILCGSSLDRVFCKEAGTEVRGLVQLLQTWRDKLEPVLCAFNALLRIVGT
jgi:hypothetical protein